MNNEEAIIRSRALLIRTYCRISNLEHDLAILSNPEHKRVVHEAPATETLTDVKRELEKAYVILHNLRAQIDVHPRGTLLDIMLLADKLGDHL